MTDIHTCKSCGETKPIHAFEILHTGNPRGTCKACRVAASSARKRTDRERAAHAQRVSNARHRLRDEIRSDLWAAMQTGRSRRAAVVGSPTPDASRRTLTTDGTGYISTIEFACRCSEREAVHRAISLCKTHVDTPKFIRELERDTSGSERIRQMNALARNSRRCSTQSFQRFDGECDEPDPFGEVLGLWPI